MDMGKRIRELRKRAGMTQSVLGKKVGTTHSAVSQWESGTISSMRMDRFLALAGALEVTPEWLLSGNGEPTRRPGLTKVAFHFAQVYDMMPQDGQTELRGYAEYIVRRIEENRERDQPGAESSLDQLLDRLTRHCDVVEASNSC